MGQGLPRSCPEGFPVAARTKVTKMQLLAIVSWDLAFSVSSFGGSINVWMSETLKIQ